MPLIHRASRYIVYHFYPFHCFWFLAWKFYSYSFGYRIDSINEYILFSVFRIRTHFILQDRKIDRQFDMRRKRCTSHTILEKSWCLFSWFHLLHVLMVSWSIFFFLLFSLPFLVLFYFLFCSVWFSFGMKFSLISIQSFNVFILNIYKVNIKQ